MSVPHTHELIRYSCVNNAVEAFTGNRKLWNRMKRFENVEMINVGIERDFYITPWVTSEHEVKKKCQ
jgi:hypothetical protein